MSDELYRRMSSWIVGDIGDGWIYELERTELRSLLSEFAWLEGHLLRKIDVLESVYEACGAR